MGILTKILSLMLTVILGLTVSYNDTASHTVLNEEECKLCISVISDSHIEGNNMARYKAFRNILNDAGKNTFGNDVAVFLGDNTMNGQCIESLLFYGAAAKADIADNYISVCGNHDVGNGEGDYDKLVDRFLTFNNATLDLDTEKPYYYKVINGYYFIVLAPEDLCVYELPMSEEQFKFLEDTLELASKSGKPIFVCAHHPYDDIEIINPETGETEYAEERITELLTKYDDVFYISGHTHMPCYEGWTFNEYGGINEINLPRCTELAGEDDNEIYDGTGWTVQIEVYDDEVVGRARNSYTGEWDDSLEYHFTLE